MNLAALLAVSAGVALARAHGGAAPDKPTALRCAELAANVSISDETTMGHGPYRAFGDCIAPAVQSGADAAGGDEEKIAAAIRCLEALGVVRKVNLG